jgi:hypothetical protein
MSPIKMANSLILSLRKFLSATPTRASAVKTVTINNDSELLRWAHWSDRKPLRLLVPPEMLRMQGGFVYDANHPFCRAVTGGKPALLDFYANVTPSSLADFYHLNNEAASGLPPWEIPWYERFIRSAPSGEAGLSSEHGVSFYGPVSESKLDLELIRIRKVTTAIRMNGYQPDLHGDIGGYILHSGKRTCFFVRGGKHRAAALTHLGLSHVPVMFRADFPRIISCEQAEYWPLVAEGRLDEAAARTILHRHIDGRGADGIFTARTT